MYSSQPKKIYGVISVAVLILVTLPYLYATTQAGSDYHFGGFLLNPIDGHSYLAKMHQGWSGQWRFTLPYTADTGDGAFLFVYYLFLGHVARISGLPKVFIFHLARLVGSAILLYNLARFYHRSFQKDHLRIFAFSLAVLGSGLGWVAILTGLFTPDFWVAEGYPFLSIYANPHFPLGLGMLLFLLDPGQDTPLLWLGVVSLFLVLILPFAAVILSLLWIAKIMLEQVEMGSFTLQELFDSRQVRMLLTILAESIPIVFYDWWITQSDPLLAVWNQQNITPSPPPGEFLLAFSPALLTAVWGIKRSWSNQRGRVWVLWMLIGAILIYLPWNLQRRFLLGYYIPLAGASAFGVREIAVRFRIQRGIIMTGLIILSLPTNVIVLASGIQAAGEKDRRIYLSAKEMDALEWIQERTKPGSLIVASPETGLFIPAYTGRKVIYGHPFETTHASQKEKSILRFYQGELSENRREEFLVSNRVDYVYYGPREKRIGEIPATATMHPVYDNHRIRIYRVLP